MYLLIDYARTMMTNHIFFVFSMLTCQHGESSQTTPKKNDAQGIDNPWRNCAHKLDNFHKRIFASKLDNLNWELDIFL